VEENLRQLGRDYLDVVNPGAVRGDPPRLAEVARRRGATPAHLAENVAAAALRLTPEDLSLLG